LAEHAASVRQQHQSSAQLQVQVAASRTELEALTLQAKVQQGEKVSGATTRSLIARVDQNCIYTPYKYHTICYVYHISTIHGVYTECYGRKSTNIRSCTVCTYGSGQPYS